MALRTIVEMGEGVLRKRAKPVEKFNLRLRLLLKDMAETMYQASGVGLAAPQVGILRRVVVVDVGDQLLELVNPEIIAAEGEQTGGEGCLSIPGRCGLVTRPQKVTVRAQNANGETFEITGEGFLARALCHELDHLEGVLYVDIMEREIFPEEKEEEQGEEEGSEAAGAPSSHDPQDRPEGAVESQHGKDGE